MKKHNCFTKLLGLSLGIFVMLAPAGMKAASHNLDSPTEWNIRFDGEQANDLLGIYNTTLGDFNNDGDEDIVITTTSANGYSGRTNVNITYVISNTLFHTLTGTGNTIDLANSSNYNLKIVGAGSNESTPYFSINIADLNNNGLNDLYLTYSNASENGHVNNGAVYIIYDSILSTYAGTGNIIDLANPANYNVKFIGAEDQGLLGYSGGAMYDFNGDHQKDLLLNADYAANPNGANSGSAYIVYNNLLSSFTGTGNTVDLANTSNFNIRIDGPSGTWTETFIHGKDFDFNNDGIDDLIIFTPWGNNNATPYSGSAYVILSTLLSPYTGTGNIINLTDPSTYNFRIDGVKDNSVTGWPSFGYSPVEIADMNGNNLNDLILPEAYASYNGRSESGSTFLIYDSILSTYFGGTGQTLDLTDPSKFNVRFDGTMGFGGTIGSYFGLNAHAKDFDSDGRLDLVSDAVNLPGVYLINNSIFGSLNTTGNVFDMADSSSYNIFYTGTTSADSIYQHSDLNGDGQTDHIIISEQSNNNGRSHSGSVYLVYNFPHTINLTPLAQPNGLSTATIQGTIDASSHSTTTVSGVQYNIDINDPLNGGWASCTADDGLFDSTIEAFTCTTNAFAVSPHTIYIRGFDSDTSYTAQTSYASILVNTAVIPTVTTQAATSVGVIDVVLNGEITATGGDNPSARGFEYGTTVSYGSSTTENGNFASGGYSSNISNLSCNTTYHHRAFATNTMGTSYGNDATFTTGPCPSITLGTLPGGSINIPYSQTLSATGGSGIYTSWTVSAGSLPPGLSLNVTSGEINGTPTQAGTSTFSITVTDSNTLTSTPVTLSITIHTEPVINTTSLPNGTVRKNYSESLTATGGSGTYTTWTILNGGLPAGLTLDTSSGQISGIPTATGTSTFSVKVTDSNMLNSATIALSLTINSSGSSSLPPPAGGSNPGGNTGSQGNTTSGTTENTPNTVTSTNEQTSTPPTPETGTVGQTENTTNTSSETNSTNTTRTPSTPDGNASGSGSSPTSGETSNSSTSSSNPYSNNTSNGSKGNSSSTLTNRTENSSSSNTKFNTNTTTPYQQTDQTGSLDPTVLPSNDIDVIATRLEQEYGKTPYSPNSDQGKLLNKLGVRITNFSDGQTIADPMPMIKGIAPAFSDVTIILHNNAGVSREMGTVRSGLNNVFLFEIPIELKNGPVTLTAKVKALNLTSTAVTIIINTALDVNPPILKHIDQQEITNDVLLKNLRVEIRNHRPTLVGSTGNSNKVTATWQSIVMTSYVVADTTSGEFRIEAPENLDTGDHEVYVVATRLKDNAQSRKIKVPFSIMDEPEKVLIQKSPWNIWDNWWIGLIILALLSIATGIARKSQKKPPLTP